MNVDQYISSGILELYAANALPPEEMKEVALMVQAHPRLRDELNAITEGLKKYAELYAKKPDDAIFDKIMDRISTATVVSAPESQPEVKTTPIVPIHKEIPVQKEPRKVNEPKPERRSTSRGYMLLMAASILLLLVSAAANVYFYNQYNEAQGTIVALKNEKNVLVENENSLKTKYESTAQELKLFTDPNNKMIMLKGMPMSPASEVMVMWNTTNKEVFVDIHKLPAPPEGMQYQLWAISPDGQPIDAGMLTPTKERKEKGPQNMKKINEAVAFAITLEKRGGSPTPSVDKMFVKGAV